MISIIITVVIISILALVMEIAAIALKLTGMNIHTARFQALSALTGTGFTTHEAESIMHNKQRRIIVMILMIIGPVGFVTILGSILISVRKEIFLYHLVSILGIFFLIIQLFKSKALGVFFHKMVERQIKKRHYFRRVILDEVLQLNQEYGVCEAAIGEHSKVINKTLSDTNFKEQGFMVLAIKRNNEILSAPKGSDKILKGDILIIFGNTKNIKQSLYG
ncbi:MAG: hypothetical protein ISS45_03380 [Candidatus Omnitrophica bacterium]|nr:hypothetical protein [Candidatus Omnitrophota bacterium]